MLTLWGRIGWARGKQPSQSILGLFKAVASIVLAGSAAA